MKRLILILTVLLASSLFAVAQQDPPVRDANNPIDPSPTVGLWNRFYSNDQSKLQLLANVTYGKWFLRFTTEYEFNYNDYSENDNNITSANFLVARLFKSKNGHHQFGVGAVVSYFYKDLYGGGINFVSVSKLWGWKFITLATLQAGKDVFAMEFQPGIYRDFNNGWYFRGHPRMLFNFEADTYEVPLGAGIGKLFNVGSSSVINLFCEPQYDLYNDKFMVYTGIKTLF